METIQQNIQEIDLGQLVMDLKREDTRYLSLTGSFRWIMWGFAILYFLKFIGGIILDRPDIERFGFLFFSFGFLSFALLFKSLHKEYKSVDYGVSTMEMLRKATVRYAFWQTKTYLTIIPMIFSAIGFSFTSQRGFPFEDQSMRVLVAFASIMLLLSCSALIGYYVWRKRQKPLRDKALAILEEMRG
jgi:hypothetical protein